VPAATPSTALDQLRRAAESGELDAFCAGHGLRLLVAFGSATDAARAAQARDLDLAMAFADAGGDVVALVADLVAWLRLDAIDLLELDRAGVVARDQALSWGLPLYESERDLFARAQMAAATERMDTAWLRRLRLERLAR
jgi:hypothetical protein